MDADEATRPTSVLPNALEMEHPTADWIPNEFLCSTFAPLASGSTVSNNVHQIIELMRKELGSQRKTLGEFHSTLEPLTAQVNSLSSDLTSLRNDVNLGSLKALFATNTRLAEVIADLNFEIKRPVATATSSSGETRRGLGLQAMGQTVSQAMNSAFRGSSVSTEGIDSVRKEFASIIHDLSAKVNALEMHANVLSLGHSNQDLIGQLNGIASQTSSTKLFDTKLMDMRLNELRAEFKNKDVAFHELLEHMALKSGYLALAASNCSAQEKDLLFSALKSKEHDITSSTRSPQPVMSLYPQNMADPRTTFDNLLNQSPLAPMLAPPLEPSPQEKTIHVQREPGMKLGLTLDANHDHDLVVARIGKGLIAGWNAQNPLQKVSEGDRVVSVNGTRGTPEELIRMTENPNAQFITMTFGQPISRPGESTVRISGMTDEKWGVTLDSDDGTSLLITKVQLGLIASWNNANPTEAIKAGDRIVAVNGTRDSPQMMLEQTKKGGEFVLGIRRS